MAQAICGDDDALLAVRPALIISGNELVLRAISAQSRRNRSTMLRALLKEISAANSPTRSRGALIGRRSKVVWIVLTCCDPANVP